MALDWPVTYATAEAANAFTLGVFKVTTYFIIIFYLMGFYCQIIISKLSRTLLQVLAGRDVKGSGHYTSLLLVER